MKEIPLTKGQVALVDDEYYEWLSAFSWHARWQKGGKFYAARSLHHPPTRSMEYMHRKILGITDSREIDHINGNSLDNRKSNLRFVSRRQNSQNLHIMKRSRYLGVTWHSNRTKWYIRVRVGKKKLYFGCYRDEEEAAYVYRLACECLFCEEVISNA